MGIGLHGQGRQTAFNYQVVQELFDNVIHEFSSEF
jgi:hypothetical protein